MSNTVDKRVVEMEFKNGEFEDSIKQTIASLDELKQALQINTTATTELSRLQTQLDSMSFDNIESSLETISSRFTTMGIVGTRVIQTLTDKAISLAAQLGSNTFGQILTGGKNRAQKVADARFQLEGLLDSATEVQSAFDSASKAVDGTAYGLDAAVSTASQLAASQVALGEDMDSALRGVAGLAAMTNSSYEEMGNIFATVAGNGRLMGMQLTQISSRGVNAAATLADYLNTTESEIRDMVSKGEIDFKTFAAAMEDAFGDQAAKANETLSGSLNNVRAALSRIGEIFYKGIIENKSLIKFINDIRVAINDVKKVLEPLGWPFQRLIGSLSALGSEILGVFDAKVFKDFVNDIRVGMLNITSWLTDLRLEVKEFKKSLGLEEEVEQAKEDTKKLREISEENKQIAEDVINGAYGNGDARREALGENYDEIQDYVNALIEANGDADKAMEIFSENYVDESEEITEANKNITASFEEFGKSQEQAQKKTTVLSDIFQIVKSTVSSILNVFGAVGKAFGKVFNIKSIGGGIKGITGFLADLAKKFEITKEKAAGIETIFTGIFTIIKVVADVVIFLAKAISGILFPVLDVIGKAFVKLTSFLGKASDSFDGFTKKHTIFKTIGDKVSTTMNKLVGTIKEIVTQLSAKSVFTDFINTLKDIASTITDKIFPTAKDAKDATNEIGDSVDNIDTGKIKKVVDYVSDKLEKLTASLKESKDKIVGFFEDISSGLSQFTGFFKKSSKEADDATKSVGDVAEDATEQPIATFNILSFVMEKTKEIAAGFFEVFIDGLKNLTPGDVAILGVATSLLILFNSIRSIAKAASNFISSFGKIGKSISSVFENISGVVGDFRKKMKNATFIATLNAITLAVGVLAASLIGLSLVDSQKLITATICLTSLIGVMYLISKALTNFGSGIEEAAKITMLKTYIDMMVGMFLKLSVVMGALAVALLIISNINTENLGQKILAFSIVMAEMVAVSLALSKWAPELAKGGGSLIAFAVAISMLAASLAFLSLFSSEKVILAAVALAGIVATIGATLAIASKETSKIKIVPILAMFAGLSIIAISLGALSVIGKDSNTVLKSAAGMSLVLLALAQVFKMITQTLNGSTLTTKDIGVFTALSAVVYAIGFSLKAMSDAEKGTNTLMAAGIMIAVLYSLVGVFALLKTITKEGTLATGAVIAFDILSLSLLVIANSLKTLLDGNYDWQKMIGAAGALAIVMVALSGSLAILSAVANGGGIVGVLVAVAAIVAVLIVLSSTITAFAKAAKILADAMKELTSIDYAAFDIALKAITELAKVLALVSLALIPASVGLVALAAGVFTLGLALGVITGVLVAVVPLIVSLMNTITKMGMLGGPISKGLLQVIAVIPKVTSAIGNMITTIIASIALGIVQGLAVLAASQPLIIASLITIGNGVISVIATLMGTLAGSILATINVILKMVANTLPGILSSLDAIFESVLGFLYKWSLKLTALGVIIALNFVTGAVMGLIAKAPDLVDKLVILAAELVGGFADALVNNGDLLSNAIQSLINSIAYTIMNILDAATSGFLSKFSAYRGTMDELANKQTELSEERAAMIAERTAKSEAEAVEKNSGIVENAYATVTDKATNQTKVADKNGAATGEAYTGSMDEAVANGNLEEVLADYTGDIDLSQFGYEKGEEITDSTAQGISDSKDVLTQSVKDLPQEAISSMEADGWKLNAAGDTLVKEVATGVEDSTAVEEAGTDVTGGLLSKFTDSDLLSKFNDSGSNIGDNVIDGLISKLTGERGQEVYDASYSLGGEVEKGLMDSTESHSPSKMAERVMNYVVEGLIISAKDNVNKVYDSVTQLGDSISNSLTDSLSSISDALSYNMDYEPTIKPVVDTSNIEMYRNTVGDLLNTDTYNSLSDANVSVNNVSQLTLANEVANLKDQVSKLANTDYSKLLEGVSVNVDATTTVDGMALRSTSAKYTTQVINDNQRKHIMARGGRI